MGILTSMLEKRSGVANPSKWLKDFFGGRDSNSGVSVNETSALTSTAVYACIRLLSDTLASLPCPVYKRIKPRGKEKATKYPLYKLIHDRANPIMPSFIWRETMMGHILGWGNCYSEIEYDNTGYPVALWPLRPDQTRPERDKVTKELYYVTCINGVEYKLPKNRVLHIPGFGFDGIKGYSPITLAREAIGLSLATEEFGARYFGSGTHPGAVVTRPLEAPVMESTESVEKLRSYLIDAYGGLGKSHRLMLLEEGMDIKNIGIPPEDSQFLETRQFQVTEIARFFGVQPHLIGDLTKSTNNNIEEQAIEFVVYTLRPWLVRWESYYNLYIIPEEDQETYFAEFLVDGLLRGDVKSRSEALQIQRRNGIINGNDWAEIENRNPLPGDLGEKYIVEGNMTTLDKVGEVPVGNQKPPGDTKKPADEAKNQQNSLKKAYERLFFDALNRIFKRENADIQREIKRENFTNWANEYYKEPPEYMEKNLLPVILSYFEAGNSNISEQKAREICDNFSKSHCKRALNSILEGQEIQIEQVDLLWKEMSI
jgi:HK97 family phage portal protein